MKILLITMPWASIDMPSIQLGILKSVVDEKYSNSNVSCEILYANVLWAEYIYQKSNGDIDRAYNYALISEADFAYGVGDWIFTKAFYGKEYKRKEYVQFVLEEKALTKEEMEIIEWMYDEAPNFIEWLMNEHINQEYDLIGFTSSFMQNMPSLAVVKSIKEKYPNTKIAFGGANCDGKQGEALHKNYHYIDFVMRGEGEVSFPQLIEALLTNQEKVKYKNINGLCYRENGVSKFNPMLSVPIDFNSVPFPWFDNYFELIHSLDVSENIRPSLILETSRGCWWGAKHQCTFCGLNGSYIGFRSQPAERAFDMITSMVKKFKTVDIFMVDNILDIKYMKELLPKIKELDWNLHIFYEVKANLMEDQIKLFHESGIKKIQPGIENLSSQVLKIMDKGITGIQNVQLLKFCEQYSITVTWNILYGFPGEKWEFYDLESMKLLNHIQPPGGAVRISLERFSPYFNKPEMGLKVIEPAKFYKLVYDLPEKELMDMAYIFESNKAGLSENQADILRNVINDWQMLYTNAEFYYRYNMNGELYFFDTRGIKDEKETYWKDPLHIEIFKELNTVKTIKALKNRLNAKLSDDRINNGYFEEFLNSKSKEGYFYKEDDKYLSLAIPYDSQRIRSNRYLEFMREEVLQ
ncbi:RiPP maturation radical SAM C-methyltransferase [Rummeliibacillus pycnus]|uniref:RiPP maturation radical SAM C-methyltransferase n=1 Tax=Rummeliibacillus pycnus TaxID=101070 RepID=UPI0037CA6D9F